MWQVKDHPSNMKGGDDLYVKGGGIYHLDPVLFCYHCVLPKGWRSEIGGKFCTLFTKIAENFRNFSKAELKIKGQMTGSECFHSKEFFTIFALFLILFWGEFIGFFFDTNCKQMRFFKGNISDTFLGHYSFYFGQDTCPTSNILLKHLNTTKYTKIDILWDVINFLQKYNKNITISIFCWFSR